MIEVFKVIFEKLEADWPVYFEEKDSESFANDYIVFKLPPGSSTKYRDDLILEVTLWSYLGERDTTHLEEKWTELDRLLRNHMHLDADQWLEFQKIGQGMIPDSDKNIRRRELRYLVKREERIDY
ncbi:hypothetical protein B0H99_101375 [Planomicrobium soli]|uniref:Uncharacterized protein n=1 Tax=Planomicrobium soli TaxID=1176648 RepID=A0A2P8H7C1_9BACL|nr:hypothetical protein [Planomicrobium soli]PSL42127.1 hypothetical protein B0H99_101375 [Planomicrobium soli]